MKKGQRQTGPKDDKTALLLSSLYSFVLIPLACGSVFVLVPSPFPFFPLLLKVIAIVNLLHSGRKLLLCSPSLIETKAPLLCEAFRTYSGWLTSKLRAYFSLPNFWVMLIAEEKHGYWSLGKGPVRLREHTVAPVILLRKKIWTKFPLKSVTENTGFSWMQGNILWLLLNTTHCKSLLHI